MYKKMFKVLEDIDVKDINYFRSNINTVNHVCQKELDYFALSAYMGEKITEDSMMKTHKLLFVENHYIYESKVINAAHCEKCKTLFIYKEN